MNNTNNGRYGCSRKRYPSPYMTCMPAQTTACTAEPRVGDTMCDDMVVAMAYVPWQELETVYEPENGFPRGTIFPELDKPLMVGGNCCG